MIFDITAAPAKEGCAFILASAKAGPAIACGARRQKGSSYCAPHHAICHISGGSVAEARRLREMGALALVVGGRRGEVAGQPPDRFLRRLERQARVFSRLQRSLYVQGFHDE